MGMLLSLPIFVQALPQQAVYSTGSANTAQHVNFNAIAQQCGSAVHPNTLQAIARVERGFNPYASGVVRGALPRQPRTHAEAVAAAKMLHAQGKNFSMGLMQVNKINLKTYGLTYETVFDPCKNIHAGSKILEQCFKGASGNSQVALQKAFSCYYSGNYRFGFTQDFKGQPSYVNKILLSAAKNHDRAGFTVPAVNAQAAVAAPQLRKTSGQVKPKPQNQKNQQPTQALHQNVEQGAFQATAAPIQQQPKKQAQAWDVFADF
jgi:type IV secretion system protein VirB1